MKKIAIALTAMAAFTGSAIAADMAPRAYTKAPVAVAPVANWTGCYVGGGGGGAYVKNDHNDIATVAGRVPNVGVVGVGDRVGPNVSTGEDGWFGTVQVGCDYQFAGTNWVVGAFGDYDFMSVRGDISYDGVRNIMSTGSQKLDSQWAVGVRAGYLVLPQLLTYVSGGYTQAHWKSTDLNTFGALVNPNFTLPGSTKGGWFIGTGDEYALSFLPGLFWKTEYRYAQFDRSNVDVLNAPAGTITGFGSTQKFTEHSVRSELVYRFNWGGPLVAKY
jgi:outer membrane immunogenic protein